MQCLKCCRLSAGVVVILAYALSPTLPGGLEVTPVLASSTCTSTVNVPGNFDGWKDGSSTWGASAYINTRGASFCSGTEPNTNDLIAAWSMTVSNGNKYYAQAGTITRYTDNGAVYFFAEFTGPTCPTFCRKTFGRTYDNENHQYSEGYNPSEYNGSGYGAMDMIVDNSLIQSTDYNPYGSWPGPWYTQFYGENHNNGDEMMGSSTEKETFTSVSYEPLESGSYLTVPNPTKAPGNYCSGDHEYYNLENVSGSAFNIWTTGC